MKTEVVLKFDMSNVTDIKTTGLMKTEVVLKFYYKIIFFMTIQFNENRSCIEIAVKNDCIALDNLFNENRSCIEIFHKSSDFAPLYQFNENRSCIEIAVQEEKHNP